MPKQAIIYFSFSNHHIHVSLQFVDSECLAEEPKLFLTNGVVDIKNRIWAENRIMSGDFRTNEKSHLFVKKIHCEDTSKLRVFISKHYDRAFQEPDKASDQWKPSLKSGRMTLLPGLGSEEGEDEFGYSKCRHYNQTRL